MMDEWLNVLVRRVAMEVTGSRQFEGTLACTSYDPKTHTVKGIVVPHGIETGNIPLAAMHTSGDSGTGLFIGPTPGDASKLTQGGTFDGDLLDLKFDMGDPNTITARHRMSQPDNPPMVKSGEAMLIQKKGNSTYYKEDGSVVQTHFAKKGTTTWDKDGNVTTDTKGAKHTTMTGGAEHTIDTGGGAVTIKSGNGPVKIDTGGAALSLATGGGKISFNG